MTNRIADISPLIYARVAGFLYLIIIVCGVFSEMYVRFNPIVPGDAATTANNIVASELIPLKYLIFKLKADIQAK